VAVDAPGCDEVVRDGDTGILTKGDPAALAEAAIGLLLDPSAGARWGRRAREVAESLRRQAPDRPDDGRLRRRGRADAVTRLQESHRRINAEIAGEKAAALGPRR
jgi:hypothetical protein